MRDSLNDTEVLPRLNQGYRFLSHHEREPPSSILQSIYLGRENWHIGMHSSHCLFVTVIGELMTDGNCIYEGLDLVMVIRVLYTALSALSKA
jgi:hypothetical protein